MTSPTEQPQEPRTNPTKPGEDQNAQPSRPEINPAKPGNETEVDLDQGRVRTYPNESEPKKH